MYKLPARRVAALTLRQRSLGLAVKHDVDAGERSVSEKRGGEPREQCPDPLGLIHAPQSAGDTCIVVEATLKHKRDKTVLENKYPNYYRVEVCS